MTEALALALVLAAAPAQDGAQLFKQRCGECHTVRALERPLRRRPAAERAPYLEEFLEKHYAPDADERRAIVRFLVK
jgi:mono/diheme cytochrome c family protein